MPIQDFAVEIQRRIARFARDRGRTLLVLRSEPELERMGAKLVAGLERDPSADAVVLGASAPFVDAARYFAAARGAIAAGIRAGAAELAGSGLDADVLAGLTALASEEPPPASDPADAPRAALDPPEIAFAAYVERVARALSGHASVVIVVLRVEEGADGAALRASMARLCEATASPRVKYVLLEPRLRPRVTPFTAHRDRLARSAVERDPRALLAAFVRSPTSRMLGLHARGDVRPLVSDAAAALAAAPDGPALATAAVPFTDPWSFFAGALDAVLAACRRAAADPAALPAPIQPEGVSLAARFAENVERLAAAALPGRALLVVLDPAPVTDRPFFRRVIGQLAESAASPRVKYVVLDAPEADLLPEPFAPVELQIETLHVTPEELESALERALAEEPLAPRERVRHLSMLAGFALSREKHARALSLSQQAVEESKKVDDAAEQALAFLGLGNALYRMAEYTPARDAYAQAVAIAVRAGSHHLAAQAMIHVGHAHFCAKEHEPAAVAYEAAARYDAKLQNPFGEALALTWLGETRRRQERWKDAEQAFEAALARYDSIAPELSQSAAEGKIEVLERLARLYDEAGLSQRSSDLRRQAKDLGGKGRVVDRP